MPPSKTSPAEEVQPAYNEVKETVEQAEDEPSSPKKKKRKKRKIYEKEQCKLCGKWLNGQTLRRSHDCLKSNAIKRPNITDVPLEPEKEESGEPPAKDAKPVKAAKPDAPTQDVPPA